MASSRADLVVREPQGANVIAFIFVVATLNLIVGYVIGAHLGWLPAWLGSGSSHDDEFVVPVAPRPIAAKPTRQAAPVVIVEPKANAEVVVEASAARVVIDDPFETTRPQSKQSNPREDMKQGLASLRNRIAELRDRIDVAAGDDTKLDECADEMRAENTQYIAQSSAVAESLGDTREDAELRSALVDQCAGIASATSQLDEMADAATADEKLAILRRSSEQIEESTTTLAQTLGDGLIDPPALETASGVTTIAKLQDLITAHFGATLADTTPLPVAWIRLDQNDDANYPPSERLLSGIAKLLESCLAEGQATAVADDEHLLVTLGGDGVADAADRLEELRQKVAAAQFAYNGRQYEATVTCAVTDSAAFDDRDALFAGLETTMNEAERFGKNRTFHHDGHLVAPVIPAAVSVDKVTLNI